MVVLPVVTRFNFVFTIEKTKKGAKTTNTNSPYRYLLQTMQLLRDIGTQIYGGR